MYDIAADGADGLCVATPARISCPASGPVRFRWGAGGDWVLVGDTVLEPETVGTAFVLAPESAREAELAQLTGAVDRDVVQALFAPAPGIPATPPSMGMIEALQRLARHPDPTVRRSVVDALVPLWRHTESDPFHADSPEILEPGLITLLANDPDVRVRRRLANRLRELQNPGVVQREEATRALIQLFHDSRQPVQRAATASLKFSVENELADGPAAWLDTLERVAQEGPPGRSACNTLAFFANSLEPSDVVKPSEGLHQVTQYHPERAWKYWFAWREHLPFEPDRMLSLLRDTVGLHRGLLRHFARTAPEDLALVLRDWEPAAPHSDRWHTVQSWMTDLREPAVRSVMGLPPAPVAAERSESPDPE